MVSCVITVKGLSVGCLGKIADWVVSRENERGGRGAAFVDNPFKNCLRKTENLAVEWGVMVVAGGNLHELESYTACGRE